MAVATAYADSATAAEVRWINGVISDLVDAAEEVVVSFFVGVQTAIEQRNRADGVAAAGSWCPWRELRRHVVPAHPLDPPARLMLRWCDLPESFGGGAIQARGTGERAPAVISIDNKVSSPSRLRALLTHELVHWERGVQPRSVVGWERDEEERVVRAITADRLRAIA
jgi:hypothetical protein